MNQQIPRVLVELRKIVNAQYDDGIDHFAQSIIGSELHVAMSPTGVRTPLNQESNFYPITENQLPPELWVWVFKSIKAQGREYFMIFDCSFYYCYNETGQTFMNYQRTSNALRLFENMRKQARLIEIEPKYTMTQDSLIIPGFNTPSLRFDFTMQANLPCC